MSLISIVTCYKKKWSCLMMKSASNGEDEEIVSALDNCVRVHIIFKSQASRSDSNSFSLSHLRSTVSLNRLSARLRSRVFKEKKKRKLYSHYCLCSSRCVEENVKWIFWMHISCLILWKNTRMHSFVFTLDEFLVNCCSLGIEVNLCVATFELCLVS